MRNLFPTYGLRNIRNFYIAAFFYNSMFILSNWVFYFATFMSKREVGIVDGIAILVGISLEIPTGAFGDMIGKRKSLIIGYFIQLISFIVAATADTKSDIIIANTMLFIGFTFVSGSQEAFVYDSLKEKGLEDKFKNVQSKLSFLKILMTVFSTFIGGILYSIDPRFPWLAHAFTMTIVIITVFFTTEPKIDSEKFSLKGYFLQFKVGFNELFSKKLRNYIFLGLILSSIYYVNSGFIRQSSGEFFGFDGRSLGFVLALVSIFSSIILLFFHKLKITKLENALQYFFLIITILSFLIPIFTDYKFFGVIFFLILNSSWILTDILNSVVINHHASSKNRATVLSTASFIGQIPYIVLVIFAGNIAQVENIKYLFIGLIVVLVVSLILKLIFFRVQRN